MSRVPDSPERKKSRSSPDVSREADFDSDPEESKSPTMSQEYSGGNLIYPNKGPNHTIEHVYSLDSETLRRIHWKECVLSNGSESLAKALASAELRDSLSTVPLAFAGRDYGTGMTEAQLEALKEGIATQPMPTEDYHWEQEMGDEELLDLLHADIPPDDDLKKLYRIEGYRQEAKRRLHAVNHVIARIPEKDQKKIRSCDILYKMLEEKVAEQARDPRGPVLERVSLYHWFMKTDLAKNPRLPMI